MWLDSTIWFHVSIIIFQLFRINFSFIIPLKREANWYFSKSITTLLPYFTSGNEECSIYDVKPFREVLGNARKSSEKFSFLVFKHS